MDPFSVRVDNIYFHFIIARGPLNIQIRPSEIEQEKGKKGEYSKSMEVEETHEQRGILIEQLFLYSGPHPSEQGSCPIPYP